MSVPAIPFGLAEVMGDPTMASIDRCHNVKQFAAAGKDAHRLIQCLLFCLVFVLTGVILSNNLLWQLKSPKHLLVWLPFVCLAFTHSWRVAQKAYFKRGIVSERSSRTP